MKKNIKKQKRTRRHAKIRTRVSGTASVPRLSVFRSNRFIYAQLINDDKAETLAFASSSAALKVGKAKKSLKKMDAAAAIGKEIAEKARTAGIKKVIFDRGGFGYKGRVKALAEAAREAGLKF